ncbi:helix-turn-helix domain-containing protein [Pseudomaricurvus alkylphenolicus]|uniref:helix-turn-helix domain-containing protein n=1 Tax=Pseudomaricurvus alkylphenolicus TaxID=1306991 RepID=UPI001422FBE2|nr:helix-turn-helix domain-containing protein [Pseudomaricurvus alkylphenolicus]NIB38757.1 helix-turn-helix domain-containing protein [Pseudomaricurvus alkylphenolicus]
MPTKTASENKVPLYGLYGEQPIESDPGFVHIEDIAERSSELGWVIKPHRHTRLFQTLCIFDGELTVSLDDNQHELSGSWLVTIPAGVVHGFRFQPDSRGFVLSVDESIMTKAHSDRHLNPATEIHLAPQLMRCNEEERQFRQFLCYIEQIREEFDHYSNDRNQALALLANLTLLSLNRQLQQNRLETDIADRESLLLNRFRALVERHFREHWPVSLYAEELHVSTSTLNRLCHEFAGASPKTIVQQRLMAEAKRRLVYTRQSVEEIAFLLGFKDQGYFSRFFKKLEGVTAGAYRKSQH